MTTESSIGMTTTLAFDENSYSTPRVYMDALINTHPYVGIPYTIMTTIALVLGVGGNVFLILTIMIHKKLQKVGREFVLNLAIADLCVAAVADPLCLIGKKQKLLLLLGTIFNPSILIVDLLFRFTC